jgi:hypothetical protein
LNDFAAVRADGVARADGDTAFDAMPVEVASFERSADLAARDIDDADDVDGV